MSQNIHTLTASLCQSIEIASGKKNKLNPTFFVLTAIDCLHPTSNVSGTAQNSGNH